jgi:hypothetical protein
MIKPLPVCVGCAHYHRESQEHMSCAAFPQGIPQEIAEGKLVHRHAYAGDNDLRYTPRPVPRDDSNIAYWKTSEHGTGTGRLVANGWEVFDDEV